MAGEIQLLSSQPQLFQYKPSLSWLSISGTAAYPPRTMQVGEILFEDGFRRLWWKATSNSGSEHYKDYSGGASTTQPNGAIWMDSTYLYIAYSGYAHRFQGF